MKYIVYAYPRKQSLWSGRMFAGPFDTKAEAQAEAKAQRDRRIYGKVVVETVRKQ